MFSLTSWGILKNTLGSDEFHMGTGCGTVVVTSIGIMGGLSLAAHTFHASIHMHSETCHGGKCIKLSCM